MLPSNHSVSSQKSYNDTSTHSQQAAIYGGGYSQGMQKAVINPSYPA